MKKVIVHWVEIRTLEVPDECPTDDTGKFEQWLYNDASNSPYVKDPYCREEQHSLTVRADTRDFEIVDVEIIEETKIGYSEDIIER